MKRTLARWQSFQPELHRYAQSTFHEGTHRQAPGDSTPWRDVSSPINRFRAWWLAPAAKGSVIAAWCITIVVGTYCFSIQQDAKGTYLLNNVLLRNLHEETQRADANQRRATELQEATKLYLTTKDAAKEKVSSKLVAPQGGNTGPIYYELELTRERARADVNNEKNQQLVKELASLRSELVSVKMDNSLLSEEVVRLRKLVNRAAAL